MGTMCNGYNNQFSECDNRQTNSVFYFVTSIVALLILTSVVLFCVCCVCLRRRRVLASLQLRTGPPVVPQHGNLSFPPPAAVSNYHSQMEEGRMGQPPVKKPPGIAVIMPGEAEVTFIAEPSSPVRTPKDASHMYTAPDESSGSFPFQHATKS